MGPLQGIKIIEIAGLGPAPMCGMLLADMGAEVILVQRPASSSSNFADTTTSGKFAIANRGKKSITLDLKKPEAIEIVLSLIAGADVLIEGFRPGVMESLGLGPDICLNRNPGLIYGRMTGWGQYGPLAQSAGHDINYIGISGALFHSGHKSETPFAPPSLVGDVGGGALFLAMGVLAAVVNVKDTGKGQVIDAAISDGSAVMCSLLHSMHQSGVWSNERGDNFIDGGSPWYDSYQCADEKYITLGAVEPQFYTQFLELCGMDKEPEFARQYDKSSWPGAKVKLTELISKKTQSQWCEILEGTDACFAPVLNFDDAPNHSHNRARKVFFTQAGVTQASPAPRFSQTPSSIPAAPPEAGQHTEEILTRLEFGPGTIEELRRSKVV